MAEPIQPPPVPDIRVVVLSFASSAEQQMLVSCIADGDLYSALFIPLSGFMFRHNVNVRTCAPHLAALFCAMCSRSVLLGGQLLSALSAGMTPIKVLMLTQEMNRLPAFPVAMAQLQSTVARGEIIRTYDELSGKVTYSLPK